MAYLVRLSFPPLYSLPAVLILPAMMPGTMVVPVLKEIVKDRQAGGDIDVAVFISIAMLGAFLSAPIAGYLSDYLKNRCRLIAFFAILDGLFFWLLAAADTIWELLLLRFLEGATGIFVISLLMASVADREYTTTKKAGALMGITGMLLMLGGGFGLFLGGLCGQIDPLLPFYLAALFMFAVGIVALVWLKDVPFSSPERANFSDLKWLFSKRPLVLLPCLYAFTDRFTVGFVVSSFNIHLREQLLFDPSVAGLCMSLVLVPMGVLSYPASILTRRFGSLSFVLVGSLIYGFFLAISGFVSQLPYLLIVLLGCGIGAGLMFIPSLLWANHIAPKELRATVMALFMGSGSLGFLLGPLASVFAEDIFRRYLGESSVIPALAGTFGSLEVVLVLLTLPFYFRWRKKELAF